MIHIDLSVPPHRRINPPHDILKRTFATWEQARVWTREVGFKTQDNCLDSVLMGINNEYVQHELEVLEVTGQQATDAVLSVEGNEDRFDADDPHDHLKYIRRWAEARLNDPLDDPSPKGTHEMAVLACKIIDRYLSDRPNNGYESRLIHIYG